MSKIGVVANPASGKDIRRLVAYATTIDNYEKVNIAKQIVLGAQAMGVDQVYFMPDTFQIGWIVEEDLSRDQRLRAVCSVLEQPVYGTEEDTVRAVANMREENVQCVVVLGGDGTCRAVAKCIADTPLLAMSTGTNNAYPNFCAGTIGGMAAGYVAQLPDPHSCCIHDKRVEIDVNGTHQDMALIDVTISTDSCIGSRAIWDPERVQYIFTTKCHPTYIGFAGVAGCVEIVSSEDDWGLAVHMGETGRSVLAPIAAGLLCPFEVEEIWRLPVGQPYQLQVSFECMIALDGEREYHLHPGDVLTVTITRNGPWRVLWSQALEQAVHNGFFTNEDLIKEKR